MVLFSWKINVGYTEAREGRVVITLIFQEGKYGSSSVPDRGLDLTGSIPLGSDERVGPELCFTL